MSIKNKHVVFFTTGLGFGGTSIVVAIATGLAHRGWKIDFVVAVHPEDRKKIDALNQSGIEVYTLGMKKGLSAARSYIQFVHLLRKLKPDILHCHSVHANILGRLARPLSNVPVVISSAHNVHEGSRLRELGYRLTDGLSDLTTQVSRAAADRYIAIGSVPKEKMIFVPNGIDVSRFCFDEHSRTQARMNAGVSGRFVWVGIGRLNPQKNFSSLLKAFHSLLKQRPDALLLIAGSGPLSQDLIKETESFGISGSVRFLGVLTDVRSLMHMADGLVMSSAWEGMPMVLLEAAASQLPIVATDVGGVSEVVLHETSGYVVPPHNSQALTAAMLKLMRLPDSERKAMGKAGRERVIQKYEIGAVVEHWASVYGELLRKKKHANNT